MREWMKGQADAALATDTPVMWCEQTQASVCLLLLASGFLRLLLRLLLLRLLLRLKFY
jgi:hypothetical protein